MDLEELNEVEDDLDEKMFLEYRQRRIAEMKASMKASSFGEVIEITGKDYVQEVRGQQVCPYNTTQYMT